MERHDKHTQIPEVLDINNFPTLEDLLATTDVKTELASVKIEFTNSNKDVKMETDTPLNSNVETNIDIKFNVPNFAKRRIGFVEFQYHNDDSFGGIKRFTIATAIQHATVSFSEKWKSDLEHCIKVMDIRQLYVVNKFMYRRLNNFLNIPVFLAFRWNRKRKCPKCHKLGCSVFKIKNQLFNRFDVNFNIFCR